MWRKLRRNYLNFWECWNIIDHSRDRLRKASCDLKREPVRGNKIEALRIGCN